MARCISRRTTTRPYRLTGAGRTVWAVHAYKALDDGAMAWIEKQRRMVENLADDYKAHRAPDARAILAGSREGLTRFLLEFAWS